MFKSLKGTVEKIDELESPNALLQNRPPWSSTSRLTSEMDTRFCIVEDTDDSDFEGTPKNSPARFTVDKSTTVGLGEFGQSSSSAMNDHLSLHAECERLNEELSSTKMKCSSLEKQIELFKRSEESTLLSVAENKMAIYKELETKEDQVKKLEKIISRLKMEKKLLLKEKAGHSSINSYQVIVDENVQEEEITKKLNEFEREMSLAFEFKECELKKLRNHVKILEKHNELLKKTNISIEEVSKTKEKKIKDLKLVIFHLERNLFDDKVSNSKKIDTLSKEIRQKSQIIKNITDKLKEFSHIETAMKENEQNVTNERITLYTDESQCKFHDVDTLKEEIELLKFTIKENEEKYKERLNNIDEINLKNNNLMKSEKELKLKINDYKLSNEKLQETIKLLQEERESLVKTTKMKIDEKQLEFDKLNEYHKNTLVELSQELNEISEDRILEPVIKNYNLLTEENAYLKKERRKMLQTCQNMFQEVKIDYKNVETFAKDQLAEWSLLFVEHIKQLKAEYSSQTELYKNNLIGTKNKLESIQKAYFALKSNCIQSLEHFKIEIIEKYNKAIMTNVLQNNEELERKNIDLLKLHEEIDYYKKSEESVKAEVKVTINKLQECIEIQKKSFTDLQNEYYNYRVTEKKKWTDKCIETENKWLAKMDNYKQTMDTEHRKKADALFKEWTNVQKVLEKIVQDVETTSRQEESRKIQLAKLNQELSELKKKNEDRDRDDDDKSGCEMKYLRNVLYEYIMGKQPMILIKVLAAIVKFDSEQLNAILKREEQKTSLFKTLGL